MSKKKTFSDQDITIEVPIIGYWRVCEAIAAAEVQASFKNKPEDSVTNAKYSLEVVRAFLNCREVDFNADYLTPKLMNELFMFFMNDRPVPETIGEAESDGNPKKQTGKQSTGSSSSTTQDKKLSKTGKATSIAA